MPRVAFATLGCRLNQVDTQEMQARLVARGFRLSDEGEAAEVVVVNTCTVTARAEASDRQAIRRLARRHPDSRIVVTGCWAQTDAEAVATLHEVDLVVGNADKHRLPELLDRLVARAPTPRLLVSDVTTLTAMPAPPAARIGGRSRAFLKVQEGCRHRCAFCIVPRARGESRSQDPKVVLDQIRLLVETGSREVTLTGVDLGSYGADLVPRTSLAALVAAIVEVPGLRWLRLSSLLPAYVTVEILDLIAGSPVIAPHMHVPLQSGSDAVLRRMRRPYTVAMYRRLVERLVAARPGLGLGADVIVGHPGETGADFDATLDLVRDLPFSYLHVFAYSDRAGTEATTLDGHVVASVVARRGRRLRELASEKNHAFRQGLVGATHDALVLETRDRATGRLVGLTGHYVEVLFEGEDALMRAIVPVRVQGADAARTWGEAA